MSVHKLLDILADGKFHSGEQLGEQLGISRSAVWKQLKKLQQIGVDHFSVKGRGYRIPGGIDLLSIERLQRCLDKDVAAQLQSIDLQLTSASTNQTAIEGVARGRCHANLYIAERQTAGRGRRGRQWVSPFARNLYFSLCWSFNDGAAALEGLSLAVGLAISQGLEQLGVDNCGLKWPNDLLWDERKLGGILLEMTGDASGLCQVVIGVGINVSMPAADAQDIDQPWVDVHSIQSQLAIQSQLGCPLVDRNRLLGTLVNHLVPALQRFSRQGFMPFRDDWTARDVYFGRAVSLQTHRLCINGIERGVDEAGALLLETETGVRSFHGGEISVRSLP